MISAAVYLLVWASIAMIVSIAMCHYANRYLKRCKEMTKRYEKQLDEASVKHIMSHKVASASIDEFFRYMTSQYARVIELTAREAVSGNDPDAITLLYAHTLARFMEYLGEDTITSIEYFYGIGFVERWCMLTYKLLAERGAISSVMKNGDSYKSLEDKM